jgi:hypothetical protein
MVAYSFAPQFEHPLRARTKRQTIRAPRKRHAKPGETLQLYIGMRTRSCRLIDTPTCTAIWPITLDIARREIQTQDRILTHQEDLDAFARSDGFKDWWEMRDFWKLKHGTAALQPWQGFLIRWD